VADLFHVLAADHERIWALANKLTGGSPVPREPPRERKAAADELVMELSRHEVIEEMLLWPAVRDVLGDDGREMSGIALQQEAHGKRVLNELVRVTPGNKEFNSLTHTVAGALREHTSYEENIVWPALRLRLGEPEANRLGAEAERARRRAPARPHPHLPPDPGLLRMAAPVAAALDSARNAFTRRP
jgi:hypothetical protein